jgi:hypothetical protein
MFRKILAVLALAVTSLFLLTGIASATDYVPPSANPSSPAGATIQVLGTSQSLVSTQGVATGPLAYTGSGINVGLVVLVGLIVLAVGIALVVGGSKLTKRGSARH